MITMIVIFGVLLFTGIVLCFLSDDFNRTCIAIMALDFILAGLFGIFFSAMNYGCAVKDSKFLNSNFGTQYTTEQMFWNGEEIKDMVIGNKYRISDDDK